MVPTFGDIAVTKLQVAFFKIKTPNIFPGKAPTLRWCFVLWLSEARAAQGLVAALLDRLLQDAQGMPGAMGEYDAWLKRGLSAG